MGSSSWFPTPSPRRWTRTGQTLTRYHPQWPDPGRPKLFQAALGNSGTGIVDGPGQANLDLSISKAIALAWPSEKSTIQLRAEFFNVFNHPQFANPDTSFSSPTFGVITCTSVNPRVGQLALRL